MKNILKITVFGIMAAMAVNAIAQNDGKGLVDRRVTLDDRDLSTEQSSPRNSTKVPDDQQQQQLQQYLQLVRPNADTAATPRYPSSDGTVRVSARIDDDSITIGDQTTLHITVEGANERNIAFPTLEELWSDAIEVLESSNDTLRGADGKTSSIEQRVTLTSFDAGRHYINNIVVRIDNNGDAVLLSPHDTLSLTVAYVADADTTKCETKADAGSIKEPFTFWEIARWVVYAILLALAVAATIWIVKRHKENKPIIVLPKAKPAPADQRALKELEALRRKELWQKGRIKKYYTDITDIVRRFLRNMYGISAAEMTTRQTLQAFHNIADWSEESESLLRQMLQKADMVKFAKMQPEEYEHNQVMQTAVDFIHKVVETHRINNPEREEDK
ncbi:MAG: DUF4381 family protein [Bacteroidales bacterium]|nr:DUF4381 family protein [Bacteroidales bacterium]